MLGPYAPSAWESTLQSFRQNVSPALLVASLVACGGEEGSSTTGTQPVGTTGTQGGIGGASSTTTSASTVGGASAGGSSSVGGASDTTSVGGAATSGTTTGGVDVVNPDRTPPATPHGLCSVTVNCAGEIPNDRDSDERATCSFEVVDSGGVSHYSGNAGVKVRGRSSREYPKLNYSVELWDDAGMDQSENLLEMGREEDWVLDGMWLDRALFRNHLAYSLFRAIGEERYAARGRYCVLDLNGDPQGIYRLGERVKRDGDRISLIGDDGSGQSFIIKQHMNGVLSMAVNQGGFGGGNPDENTWQLIYPNQESATDAQIDGVQAWLDSLSDARENNPEEIFTSYLDLDDTADWILVQELAKNIDAFHLSIHMYKDTGGLARFVPWDFDLSMGQPTVQGEAGNDAPEGWVINGSDFYDEMLSTSALPARIGTRWAELRQGPFSDAMVSAWIDSFVATLEPTAVESNFALWPMEEVDFQQIYPPYTLYDIESHAAEVEHVRGWLSTRLAWIDANVGTYPN